MPENFSVNYNIGILSKKLFLESEITRDFIDWLLPLITGDNKLSEIYKYKNFIECINNYKWQKDLSFEDTLKRFKGWKSIFYSSDETVCNNICIDILKWGGVSQGNTEKIAAIQNRMSLKDFFYQQNEISNKNIIKITDLDNNYISSGFTKLYTATNENFFMYDGRVGCAMCCLIAKYMEEKKENELPDELVFGYGEGRSKDKNRNPNNINKNVRFSNITSNRKIHFISNIKLNWLLYNIAERVIIPDIPDTYDKAFALQTALFVLGEKIPVQREIIQSNNFYTRRQAANIGF